LEISTRLFKKYFAVQHFFPQFQSYYPQPPCLLVRRQYSTYVKLPKKDARGLVRMLTAFGDQYKEVSPKDQ
jgi:hypothetical protein